MTGRATPTGIPLITMWVLMLSVFTVSMGYGIVLPLLPYLIERLLGAASDASQVSRATGLLRSLGLGVLSDGHRRLEPFEHLHHRRSVHGMGRDDDLSQRPGRREARQ